MTSNGSNNGETIFSIVIPTWNNLSLLQSCITAIQQNTTIPYEIVIHVNEGSDGTVDWLKHQSFKFTYSETNIGICRALNIAVQQANAPYIVYLNDDMVVCPNWDSALFNVIKQLNTNAFMLSGTMIEPRETRNPCVIVSNCGLSPETLDQKKLIETSLQYYKKDWYGATWPPCVVHRQWWDKVGGYSEEFSPGMSSDNDFSMKMWQAGCRIFLGVGQSRVYHFMSKSTGKVVRNDGRKQFLKKWGITQTTFDRHYLRRGQPAEGIVLREPDRSLLYYYDILRSKLKLLVG
ncbi:glycosyltransferase [Ferrovum sp. PN-J185]|uniref:glycosyltransferase family 2 protein n=1 Tax=Ferrovum sp. PN-J185 TaxID=1356306 RepID=UPI0007978BA0|nr:glycosyltransferase [Ferrovum sp. PN-J185]KXW55924.1 putative glycosyl transferase [Ferrovum sp. PN-J185]MCC6068687.1 glycosyltransferase [Ferrovum sp. PN-J185]